MRFGYTFSPTHWMISPFLGLGIYNVYAIDHHNHQGFSEDLPYVTAGVHSLFAYSAHWNLGVNFKAFRTYAAEEEFKFHGGKVKTHDNLWGAELGIPFMWHIGRALRWDITLEPYFLKLALSETQNIYGTRLLFGYRF